MTRSYIETAEGYTFTVAEARYEICVLHGQNWQEFLADAGEREEYDATEVLEWLGY